MNVEGPFDLREEKKRQPPIAVVDDDPTIRRIIGGWLTAEGHRVLEYDRGARFVEALEEMPAVVCLDLRLGDMSGIDVLRLLQARDPELPVVVITAQGDAPTAVEAMRAGAYDYIVKPLDRDRVVVAVRRALERRQLAERVEKLQAELGNRKPLDAIIGESAPMQELSRQVQRVLDSDVAVVIHGESGTGKELVARAIHHGGRRRAGPFIAINCAAIPESLHESELFGHERGAFTGAVGVHQGRFEQAHGGTLFLDEIGEMSPLTQASLLRTLQERSIRRVGGSAEIPVDVRVICATHRDLLNEVRAGRFREDLYFRLVVYPITLPTLRARRDDIPLLVGHFLEKHKRDVGRDVRRVTSDALSMLCEHSWPGNVRELENVVHRGMLACDGEELDVGHLPPDLRMHAVSGGAESHGMPRAGGECQCAEGVLPLRELERRAIKKALRKTDGSVEKAAKLLGMGRATLYRRLAHYEALGQEMS